MPGPSSTTSSPSPESQPGNGTSSFAVRIASRSEQVELSLSSTCDVTGIALAEAGAADAKSAAAVTRSARRAGFPHLGRYRDCLDDRLSRMTKTVSADDQEPWEAGRCESGLKTGTCSAGWVDAGHIEIGLVARLGPPATSWEDDRRLVAASTGSDVRGEFRHGCLLRRWRSLGAIAVNRSRRT